MPSKLVRVLALLMIVSLGAVGLVPAAAAGPRPASYTVETWRSVEIGLTAKATYPDPFADVQVTATFRGPRGQVVTRPAFWDGGSSWKVRFAPPAVGVWTMRTSSTDAGLDGVVASVRAVPYQGSLEIYQHGFLKPSADGHYLQHADGTPFFYLGDTHWILPHERFDTSNAPGVDSQFKYVVDKRVGQGFTVFQSEPIWQPHGGSHTRPDEEPAADLTNGLTGDDLAGFAEMDKKFAYIADAGLVHANAMVAWAAQPHDNPGVMTPDYMAAVARYWDARYGAYPVIWTVAQEIDNDFYGVYAGDAMAPWTAAIKALDAADAYDQPLMPHQENSDQTSVTNSRFATEPWHDGFAAQLQYSDGWNLGKVAEYWASGKPSLAYETPYEDFWTDSRHALSALYKAYLLGLRGYGYGVAGVWNDVYSAPGEPIDAGTDYEMPARYQWWYTGANRQTADQLTHGVQFFRGLNWWKLTPRFGDAAWSDFGANGDNVLASDENRSYVALFTSTGTTTGTIRKLDPDHYYTAAWFNPRTGQRTPISTRVEAAGGSWSVPARPTAEDWVLTVDRGAPIGNAPRQPVADPAGGAYQGVQPVRLSTSTGNATIHYTTDGTTPTPSSPVYSDPVRIADPMDVQLRAITTRSGQTSTPMTATYRQQLPDLTTAATLPANVADRNRSTGWAGSSLEAVFRGETALDTVIVTGSGQASYQVDYWDGQTWQTAASGSGPIGGAGAGTVLTFPRISTTKVRFVASSAVTVTELGLYRHPLTDAPDLTAGGSYSASSSWDAGQVAAKAFDNDPGTNWQACDGCWAGQWLAVDFGRSTTFNAVAVSEYGNRTTTYRIEYWDGTAWQTAYSGTGGFGQQGETTTVTFPDVTGSKARILYLSGTGNAPIVYQLSIYRQ
ncbi:DUF4038 domain-containing protein [Kribbella sp. NPDC049227]|uniref:apiosidase-like domain-containing protein n=1 Tax=Kribbella sp. NPDC049227 TaxID=3364113 RepID=UPI0037184280